MLGAAVIGVMDDDAVLLNGKQVRRLKSLIPLGYGLKSI